MKNNPLFCPERRAGRERFGSGRLENMPDEKYGTIIVIKRRKRARSAPENYARCAIPA
jgi:hypothetical protein